MTALITGVEALQAKVEELSKRNDYLAERRTIRSPWRIGALGVG